MGDDGSAKTTNIWPLPKFHFRVSWGGAEISFQEVSGLDTEPEVIEYRAGNEAQFSRIKMPGMVKNGNVTMKKGVFANDHALWDWYNDIRMNVIKRREVTIALLDESGAPVMVWRLRNAFPVKISGTDLKAEGNEVAVESLELAHEGFSIVSA